jgi:hypothetical protein
VDGIFILKELSITLEAVLDGIHVIKGSHLCSAYCPILEYGEGLSGSLAVVRVLNDSVIYVPYLKLQIKLHICVSINL